MNNIIRAKLTQTTKNCTVCLNDIDIVEIDLGAEGTSFGSVQKLRLCKTCFEDLKQKISSINI